MFTTRINGIGTGKAYTSSEEVKAAKKVLDEHESKKPGAYQSSWEPQLKAAMDQILNREDFRYNLRGDALYQQYRDQAVRNGRMAMMDTMGQAAAMTGGYGNSYAQNVGQQAYQQNLASLNDRIPELYALALERYRMQGDELRGRYDLLQGREDQDYGRYRDGVADWQSDARRLWETYTDQRDFDYNGYRDTVADSQWQAEFDDSRMRYLLEWLDEHPQEEKKKSSGSSGSAAKPAAKTEQKSNTLDTKKKNLSQKTVTL